MNSVSSDDYKANIIEKLRYPEIKTIQNVGESFTICRFVQDIQTCKKGRDC